MRPEARHRLTDRLILRARSSINISGVGNLALGRGLDAVDLAVGQLLELVHAHLASEDVDAGVLEELLACAIGFWKRGVLDQLGVVAAR